MESATTLHFTNQRMRKIAGKMDGLIFHTVSCQSYYQSLLPKEMIGGAWGRLRPIMKPDTAQGLVSNSQLRIGLAKGTRCSQEDLP